MPYISVNSSGVISGTDTFLSPLYQNDIPFNTSWLPGTTKTCVPGLVATGIITLMGIGIVVMMNLMFRKMTGAFRK